MAKKFSQRGIGRIVRSNSMVLVYAALIALCAIYTSERLIPFIYSGF